MNEKTKWNILILLIILCLVIFLIGISDDFINNVEIENKEQSAIVTFHLDNSTPVTIFCEVASSAEKRSVGLMFNEELPEGEGILFVYDFPHNVSFWMKNTFIPLDIIFLDETGTVINVEEADVELNVSDEKLKRYLSTLPTKWVVETNQGLCKTYGIEVGTNVSIEYL